MLLEETIIMKKKFTLVFALLAVAVCLAVLTACGGGTKATKANIEKIDNTMDLTAVEAIIGKADHDLRGGALEGRVAWNVSFDSKKTTTCINIFIDFDKNGKVEKLDAQSDTNPIEGGQVTTDWNVKYPR